MLQDNVIYDDVCLPSKSFTKNDVKLEWTPSYSTSPKVVMVTNPTYIWKSVMNILN